MNILSEKKFYPTFWTQLLGSLNNNLFKNAFIILLTFKLAQLSSSKNLILISSGLFILPFFLFSAFAGDLSDKYPKHVLSKNLKLLELLIVILGSIGFVFHLPYLLLFCLFLIGTQASLYGPIKYSILPELLAEEQLVEANAFVEMGTFLAILTGTLLGGILINISYGEWIVSFSCIALSLLGYWFSLKIPKLEPVIPSKKLSYNILSLTSANLKLVFHQKYIFLTVLAISWFWFLGASILSLFPILVKDYLHGNESLVTIMLAIFSIGVAIGSIICEKISNKNLELGLVPIGSIGMFISLVDLYFSLKGYPKYFSTPMPLIDFFHQKNSIKILIDLFLFAIFGGIYSVPLYAYLQIRTQREERSRIIASNNILNALFMVFGAVLLFILSALSVSLTNTILIIAILTLCVSVYIYWFMPEFLLRLVCWFLVKVIYNLKTVNLKPVQHDRPVVYTANHVSFIDWLIIAGALNRPVRFVIDYHIYKNPILNPFFRMAKLIPITSQKNNPVVFDNAFKEIKKSLAEGESVCIFPEGKISADGNLNLFKPGIERIISESPVPVQPLVLKNLYGSFFSRSNNGKAFSKPILLLKNFRKNIEIHGLEEVPAEKVSASLLQELTQKGLNN